MMCQFNCGNQAVYRSRSVNLCSYCGEDQTFGTRSEAELYGLARGKQYDVEQIDNGRWFTIIRN